jgi:transposase
MENHTIVTIGCDLGDKTSALFVVYPDGSTKRDKVKTTPAAMEAFFQQAPAHVVIEVGAHSRWVSELLARLGHRVTVANPRRVKLISEADTKTDRADAELLARLGRADVQLLAPIRHRGRDAQRELALIKARDLLVRSRTKLVAHVRGVVKSFGERLPVCSAESFHRRTRDRVPLDLQVALDPLYEALEGLERQIRAYDQLIKRAAEKNPDVAQLSQVHGVGVLTALAYVLIVEDKDRFAKSRMAGAFIGLRPRKDQSGDGDPQLRITKTGDALLRRLLVNSANHILGPFGADSDLRRWGLKLSERGGKNARKRAKVAVARKLAVILHRLWVTGEVYESVGYQGKTRLAA